MTEKTMAIPEAEKSEVPAESKRHTVHYVKPPVDIFETTEGLVLVADIPGITQDELDISVERNVLTIHGRREHGDTKANGHTPSGRPSVFRQFRLGDAIDSDQIAAELKHGVLRLHLPKAEANKARKVDVKVS